MGKAASFQQQREIAEKRQEEKEEEVIDNQKFGNALASTMDRIEKLERAGELQDYDLTEVLVIATFIKPFADRNREIEPDALESLIFVDGSTQIPYVQTGILTMALDTVNQVAE